MLDESLPFCISAGFLLSHGIEAVYVLVEFVNDFAALPFQTFQITVHLHLISHHVRPAHLKAHVVVQRR
ncbi:hypothetical protein AGR7B_Cc10165 [Agrobacterium deltaense RV3]|nr:hypothetical protein AGR7B_Cc10165 [Agrobacterium deltaense RV3]